MANIRISALDSAERGKNQDIGTLYYVVQEKSGSRFLKRRGVVKNKVLALYEHVVCMTKTIKKKR
jgi:hypothetical protein